MVFIMSTARATAAAIKEEASAHIYADAPAIGDNLTGPGMWDPVPAFAHRGDVNIVFRVWRVDAGWCEDHATTCGGVR